MVIVARNAGDQGSRVYLSYLNRCTLFTGKRNLENNKKGRGDEDEPRGRICASQAEMLPFCKPNAASAD